MVDGGRVFVEKIASFAARIRTTPSSDLVSRMEMRGIADVGRVFVEVAPVVWSATSR